MFRSIVDIFGTAEYEVSVLCALRKTDIAQNRKKPRLHRRAYKSVEIAEGAQIAFLHRIFDVGARRELARQRIDIVEMRQGERFEFEAARLVLIFRRANGSCLTW